MRSMCGADAGCLEINYQSLFNAAPPPGLRNSPSLSGRKVHGKGLAAGRIGVGRLDLRTALKRASDPPQTDAIEEDPHDSVISDSRRIV
jgi:hypothetical protein